MKPWWMDTENGAECVKEFEEIIICPCNNICSVCAPNSVKKEDSNAQS